MIGESDAVSSDIASKISHAETRPQLRKLLNFPGSKGEFPKRKNGIRSQRKRYYIMHNINFKCLNTQIEL